MSHYKLDKKCLKCGIRILDRNKSGFCIKHIDRTGKNNPFFGKKHLLETIEKSRPKIAHASTEHWKDDAYRRKVIAGTSKPRKASFKLEQSIRIKQWYKDNPEQRIIRSKAMTRSWLDGKIIPYSHSCNISKLETKFYDELSDITSYLEKITIHYNKHWFFPDITDQRAGIIIEFYGDYFHANPNKYKSTDVFYHNKTAQQIWDYDEKRQGELESIGYHVIIIWEQDYKNNKEGIFQRLNELLNWDTCTY